MSKDSYDPARWLLYIIINTIFSYSLDVIMVDTSIEIFALLWNNVQLGLKVTETAKQNSENRRK